MAMNPEEMMQMLQQQQGGGAEAPAVEGEQPQDAFMQAEPGMEPAAEGTPQDPMAGQPQEMMQPQQPDPTEIVLNLLMERAQDKQLNAEVQAKVILTLAQAVAQLNQEQPQQIPPEAQYQLEVTKMQMEHERLSHESEQKLQIMQQESQQKMQLAQQQAEQKAQLDQMKMQIDQQNAESKLQMEQEKHQLNQEVTEANAVTDTEIKQRDSLARAKQMEQQSQEKKSQQSQSQKKAKK